MKRCDKTVSKGFPDVKRGDVVEKVAGDYCGCVYMVVGTPARGGDMLVCLDDGKRWADASLWGDTAKPSDWRKVNCCYSVEE